MGKKNNQFVVNDSIAEHPKQSHFLNSYRIPGKSQCGCRTYGRGGSYICTDFLKGKYLEKQQCYKFTLKITSQIMSPNRHYQLLSILSTQTHREAGSNIFVSWLHNFSHAFAYLCFNISQQEVYTARYKEKKNCFSACEKPPNFFHQT